MSDPQAVPEKPASLCWICNRNEANSREHKTKKSDLLAVLGKPTQDEPFYFSSEIDGLVKRDYPLRPRPTDERTIAEHPFQDFPPPFIVGNPNYPELYPQP